MKHKELKVLVLSDGNNHIAFFLQLLFSYLALRILIIYNIPLINAKKKKIIKNFFECS